MSKAPRLHTRSHELSIRLLRGLIVCAACVSVANCGGAAGGGNDGEFVTRTGIVVTGIADDGTATSPLAGGTCRAIDRAGRLLDTSPVEADGSYLLLVDPGQQVFVVCADADQSSLAIRTLVSTVGIPAGGELPGQDVLPATTMLARIVAQESADDSSLDAAVRLRALRARLLPFGSTETPIDADLQLLADAATITYDRFRDAGVDADLEAVLVDLFDDGRLDFFPDTPATAGVETDVAQLETAAGRSLPDALLATHPAFDFTILNLGGARSAIREVARFATILDAARTAAGDRALLALSGGNTLSSGLPLFAGLDTQDPFFDALAVDRLGVDAFAVGGDDLELGPPVFGIFLDRIAGGGTAVLTDIDASREPNAFIPGAQASVATVLILERSARRVGVVSATPEDLPRRTSTRSLGTFAGDARVTRIQAGIDGTRAAGARLQILLTSITSLEDVASLVDRLTNVDVVVTLPGVPQVAADFAGEGPMPVSLTTVTDADGRAVPVVPGIGDYAGLVVADLRADPLGLVDAASSSASVRRVAGADEAVPTIEDADLRAAIIDPLEAAILELDQAEGGQSEVVLDRRTDRVFAGETNWGNLVADAVLFSSRSQANSFQSFQANASIVDVGSIDGAEEIPAGAFSRAELFGLIDAGQVVGVLQRVATDDLKRLLEFSFARIGTDLFAQVGALQIEFDPDGTAQVIGEDGTVEVPGSRVVNVRLNGDNALVLDGVPVADGPVLSVAVTERVRDAYPLGDLAIINVGLSTAQALEGFIRVTLRGTVREQDFPVGGANRISVVTP